MTTKLFERLVTKFSIKVSDLIKYLNVSKATIYNDRNLENFSDIPKERRNKILYLFGKETEEELELVLDENDPDILTGYFSRLASIFADSLKVKKDALASIEELSARVERLTQENADLKRQVVQLEKFSDVDDFTREILFDKIATITAHSAPAEMKEFLDYLDIFAKYRSTTK